MWRLCPGSRRTTEESIFFFFFFLAPQSQHIKTSSRSAGLLPLSVLHTLARTMRSDPHTALLQISSSQNIALSLNSSLSLFPSLSLFSLSLSLSLSILTLSLPCSLPSSHSLSLYLSLPPPHPPLAPSLYFSITLFCSYSSQCYHKVGRLFITDMTQAHLPFLAHLFLSVWLHGSPPAACGEHMIALAPAHLRSLLSPPPVPQSPCDSRVWCMGTGLIYRPIALRKLWPVAPSRRKPQLRCRHIIPRAYLWNGHISSSKIALEQDVGVIVDNSVLPIHCLHCPQNAFGHLRMNVNI